MKGKALDMSAPTVEIAGTRYVIVPEAEFAEMREAAGDAEDIAALRRSQAQLARGEEELIPADVVDRLLAGENPIRVWREHRGLTATALAERAGLGRPYVSQLEAGTREGTVGTILALARALDVEPGDLFEELARSRER